MGRFADCTGQGTVHGEPFGSRGVPAGLQVIGDIVALPEVHLTALPHRGVENSSPRVLNARVASSEILRIVRTPDGYERESLLPVSFVPMTGEARERG